MSDKIFTMEFRKIYDLLVKKAVRKMRTPEEVNELICWITGYLPSDLNKLTEEPITYADFILNAPHWNDGSKNIKGKICGVRIETIEDPTMWKIRCLDKTIDELAKGKRVDQIIGKYEKDE